MNIKNRKEAKAACILALQESKSGGVLVEKYYRGYDYRILMINGRVLRGIEIMPAKTGSESISVRELKTSNRRLHYNDSEKNLQQHDYSCNSPNEANRSVCLDMANTNADKTVRDFTSKIHFENIYLAQVAAIVALDAVEIEIICQDLSVPMDDTKGAIINVNSYFL